MSAADYLFTLLLWIKTHDIAHAEIVDDSILIGSHARDLDNQCDLTLIDYVKTMSEARKVLGY